MTTSALREIASGRSGMTKFKGRQENKFLSTITSWWLSIAQSQRCKQSGTCSSRQEGLRTGGEGESHCPAALAGAEQYYLITHLAAAVMS